MVNYQINDKGDVGLCHASMGNCPFSSFDNHFNSPEKAQAFYENFMDNLNNSNKSTMFYFVSNREKLVFTTADCPHFAKYLNKKSGLPIRYLGDTSGIRQEPIDREWSHFVNQLPDGRYIDAEGIWTREDLIKRWQIDELGRKWMPNSINEVNSNELRKMGVQSPIFPEIKPNLVYTKIKKHISLFVQI